MSDSFFQTEVVGHVGWVTLDRPEKLNALGLPFWEGGMADAVAALEADPAVRVIVVRGAGRAFTAGLDLQGVAPQIMPSGDGVDGARKAELHRMIRRWQASVSSVERCRVPTIAAIHGPCIGGGIDLATACDMRICSADAKFSVREVRIGIVADMGTLQRLPGIVGQGVARELALTGRDFGAEEALRIGLVNRVLPDPEALFAAAATLAEEVGALPPLAVQGTKAVMVQAEREKLDRGLEYVATWNAAHLLNQDLMRAFGAMMSGEPPTFEGN